MEELDIATVRKRSIHGVLAFVTRSFFIQFISLVVSLILTIFLSPSTFGVFFIVTASIAFLSYFSDIGLAAALVQKKENITDEDLKTTFTIQQGLVLTFSILALLFSENIGKFYNLDHDGIELLRALVFAFFLSSLKTIPSILLERNLHFQKLVIPQIIETVFFNLTVLFFAVAGYEIRSFTFAVLARGVSGVIAMYAIAPWRIGFGFSRHAARKLLSFGVPFQINSLLALVKDDLIIVYLGRVLPLAQVGYIGFAQKWAFMPLRLVMDNVIRVTFPSFSRMQDDKSVLAQAIEKSLFVVTFITFPCLVVLVVLFPYFIDFVPRYQKWEPAFLSLMFFAINAMFSSISTLLTNALNAIGRINATLRLMIFWTTATWVLTPVAILNFGFNGVAGVSAIVSMSVVIVIYIVRRYVSLSVFKAVRYPFLASFFMGCLLYFLSRVFTGNLITLFVTIIIGGLFYLGLIFMLARRQLIADMKIIVQNLRR